MPESFDWGGKRTGRRIGYGRVSTADQTIEQQRLVLREAGCADLFVEKISSGVAAKKRKALMNCLDALQPGDTLVVTKLDRLGRTQSEVIARLNELNERGIHLETLDGLLNTRALGKMAPLMVGLLTGLAEVERSLIRERTRESVAYRKRTGGKLGGRPPVSDQKRELAILLRDEGKSFGEIAEALEVSKSTAHKLVKAGPKEPNVSDTLKNRC